MPDYDSEFSNLIMFTMCWLPLAMYPNMPFSSPPLLKHVPAQGGERNAKGLLKRRSLEKIKFLQQFWSTAARGCRIVFMWGGAAPSGFSV